MTMHILQLCVTIVEFLLNSINYIEFSLSHVLITVIIVVIVFYFQPTMGISMLGKKPSRRILSSSPSPASPPPDYPGLEYPPVFEPETYTLSDASSLLRSRQQSHANSKQHTMQSHNSTTQNWVSDVIEIIFFFFFFIIAYISLSLLWAEQCLLPLLEIKQWLCAFPVHRLVTMLNELSQLPSHVC
jgi:hypothetical protein